MARVVVSYALALALAAALVAWVQYRNEANAFSTELYITLIAIGFTALGLWAGSRLTRRPAPVPFVRNEAAVASLGLTSRECEILALLASGKSNKEIAHALGVSPNTVKTHVARVYEKLAVRRRMQAVEKARWLALIPAGDG
jgi:DNA-binding CsgD family transcriptional regulator